MNVCVTHSQLRPSSIIHSHHSDCTVLPISLDGGVPTEEQERGIDSGAGGGAGYMQAGRQDQWLGWIECLEWVGLDSGGLA